MSLLKINLLESFPNIKRDIKSRLINKDENRRIALEFGKEYFDGNREQGYGGYVYDGRWEKVAKRIIELFDLKKDSKFLDIGCAKGFLMHDMKRLNLGIDVHGVEISDYAITNSMTDIKNKIIKCSCEKLPFEDNYFDAVVAINVIHNLDLTGCKNSIKEIQRVSGGKAFIQVDAFRDEKELLIFKDWMLTAKTYLKPDEWIDLFKSQEYTGYYYWTILEL